MNWLRRATTLRLVLPLFVVLGFVIVATASVPSSPAGAAPGDDERHVQPAGDPVPGQYIVTLRPTNPGAIVPTVSTLTQRHGGRVLAVYGDALQGFALQTSAADAEALATDPAVASVEQNGYVKASDVASPRVPTPSWGLDRIDQRPVGGDNSYSWNADGAGVRAYLIDTGINTSLADFGGRATVGADMVSPSTGGQDCAGHGTHVAGTLGGDTYGVAKKVLLVAVRVLGCDGKGSFAQVIAGVNWVTANAVKPAVANMSLGGEKSTALDTAVANSIASGITYSIAAGNTSDLACNSSPGDVPTALTVGASTISDARASFSNFGTCVDLFAPGQDIVSDWYTAPFTKSVTGTSMSTPHVTGVAANYLASCPSATVSDVTNAIILNATNGAISSAGAGSPTRLLYGRFTTGDASSGPNVPCPPALSALGGNNVAHLSWTLNAAGVAATSVSIYRATTSGGEGATPLVSGLSPSVSSYDDTSTLNGTTYYYQVAAVNAAGESRSAEQSVLVARPPDPPTLSTPTAGNGTVHLAWTAPASNGGAPVTAYRVYRGTSTGGEGTSPIATLGSASTSFDDAGLTNGTTYFYQVAAVNAAGETRSSEKSARPVGPPGAPTVTTAPHLDRISLIWSAPADGGKPLTGYTVWRATTPTFAASTAVASLGPTTTSFDDTTVARGVTYFYWVTAANGLGAGPPSVAASGVAGASVDVFGQTTTGALTVQRVMNATAAPPSSLGFTGIGGPAVVTDSSGTAVFMRGSDSSLWWQRLLPSGRTAWTSLGGGVIADPVAVATGSEVDVFVRGTDYGIYWKRITGTVAAATPTSGYSPLGGYAASPPSVAAVGNTKFVFVRGGDGGPYLQRVTTSVTAWQSLGGYVTSDPAATPDAIGTGGVTVFARGGDQSMYRQHVGADGTPGGWSGLGGGITSNPASAFDGTSTYVFARGGEGSIYYQQLPPNSPPSGWILLGGYSASDPRATFDGTKVRVLVRGGDNGLYWQIPSGSWVGLSGTFTSNPAIAAVP